MTTTIDLTIEPITAEAPKTKSRTRKDSQAVGSLTAKAIQEFHDGNDVSLDDIRLPLEAFALESLTNSIAGANALLALAHSQTRAAWADELGMICTQLSELERAVLMMDAPPGTILIGWENANEAIQFLIQTGKQHSQIVGMTGNGEAVCPVAATILLAKTEVRRALSYLKATHLTRIADNGASMDVLRYLTTLMHALNLLAMRANRTYGSR